MCTDFTRHLHHCKIKCQTRFNNNLLNFLPFWRHLASMFNKSDYKAEILSREKFNIGFKIAEFYADFKSAGDVRKVIQSVIKKKV
jgi:hypothetical protein